MPIDPSISLGAQGVGPLVNPLQMVQQVEQMKAQRENAAALTEQRQSLAQERAERTTALQQQNADRVATGEAIRQGGGVREQTLALARQNSPNIVPSLTEFFDKAEERANGIRQKRNELAEHEAEFFGDAASEALKHGASPEAIQTALAFSVEQFPEYKDRATQIAAQLKDATPEQRAAFLEHVRDSAPSRKKAAATFRDVGPGQTVMDGTGKVVYTAPAKEEHSASFKEFKDAQAEGYKGSFTQYQDADANRKKAVVNVNGMGAFNSQTDPKAIAEGIKNGTLPPQLTEYGRGVQGAVATELSKGGFNLAQAATDWKATQKHVQTMNGAQQLRLNQSINALPDLLDSVDTLAGQWKANAHLPMLNRANLAAAKSGLYGQESASLANQLETQIADVVGDLGTVYMGGNSPTDHGLKLAETALKGEWDAKVIHDMVTLAKKNVVIRRNSITNTGVAGASESNPYAGGGQQPTPVAAPSASPANAVQAAGQFSVTAPNGKVYTFKSKEALEGFKRRAGIS